MWRSPQLLQSAQHHSCQADGCGGTHGVVAAHSNSHRHGKGWALKAHDCFVAFLCWQCHTYVDQGKAPKAQREAVWMNAWLRSVPLFRKFLDDEARGLIQSEVSE